MAATLLLLPDRARLFRRGRLVAEVAGTPETSLRALRRRLRPLEPVRLADAATPVAADCVGGGGPRCEWPPGAPEALLRALRGHPADWHPLAALLPLADAGGQVWRVWTAPERFLVAGRTAGAPVVREFFFGEADPDGPARLDRELARMELADGGDAPRPREATPLASWTPPPGPWPAAPLRARPWGHYGAVAAAALFLAGGVAAVVWPRPPRPSGPAPVAAEAAFAERYPLAEVLAAVGEVLAAEGAWLEAVEARPPAFRATLALPRPPGEEAAATQARLDALLMRLRVWPAGRPAAFARLAAPRLRLHGEGLLHADLDAALAGR